MLRSWVAFDVDAPVGLVGVAFEGMDATLDGNVTLVTLPVGLAVLALETGCADTSLGSIDEEPEEEMRFLSPQPPGFPSSGG